MNIQISICIPAYNRTDLLKRLLDSICIQDFKDYEVIVTDDSRNDSVKELCNGYSEVLPIRYFKNTVALGTPENWNGAVRKANGEWIKIMHDDDWFSGPESLAGFVQLTKTSPESDFVFSGSSIYQNEQFLKHFSIGHFELNLLKADPANLFCKNTIGPPSVVMYRNNGKTVFDNRMKWLVDVDFYIQCLKSNNTFFSTRESLINVGFNEQQVTNQVIHDKAIVIPETFLLLQKTGVGVLKRLWNYDFAWRLTRNYGIREMQDLEALNPCRNDLSKHFKLILSWQRHVPASILKIGAISKIMMLFNFLFYKFSGKRD